MTYTNGSKNSALKCNQLTESETVKGRNGVPLFNEWHRPEEPDDCSRGDIARAYRVRSGY